MEICTSINTLKDDSLQVIILSLKILVFEIIIIPAMVLFFISIAVELVVVVNA